MKTSISVQVDKASNKLNLMFDLDSPSTLFEHYSFMLRDTKNSIRNSLSETILRMWKRYQKLKCQLNVCDAYPSKGLISWIKKARALAEIKSQIIHERRALMDWICKSLSHFA